MIDDLVKQIFDVKNRLRDYKPENQDNWTRTKGRKILAQQKNELLLQLKVELNNISKAKAKEIRDKLFEDLGVII